MVIHVSFLKSANDFEPIEDTEFPITTLVTKFSNPFVISELTLAAPFAISKAIIPELAYASDSTLISPSESVIFFRFLQLAKAS